MKKSQFQALIDSVFKNIAYLTATKGEEYSNTESAGDADQHANFKRQGASLGMKPSQVLMVYLGKHLDGIMSFVRTGVQHSEPIEGRIDDAILYLLLLRGLVQEEREVAATPKPEIKVMVTDRALTAAHPTYSPT